jgi:ribosomal protein S18 acetylase RimI-like enzyme
VKEMSLSPIGLQIRQVAGEDYNDVYRLYRQLVSANYCQSEDDFARIFKGFLNSKEREAFVATVHNCVIGFVTLYYFDVFHYGGQVASIQELVVTEEFRGRGVGQALVGFVRKQTTERHCRGLEVATDLWQGGAKSFYKRCGFRGRSLMVAT